MKPTQLLICMLGVSAAIGSVCSARAQSAYAQHNLVSDVPGLADHTDPNLLNPWGIAFSATSPFWISDNHSGLSTLYNGSGTPQTLVVTVPPPAGCTPPGAPTGIIFNNTTNFIVASNAAARFIFATEDGTISAWASGATAVLKVDNSASSAIYKGLALGNAAGSNYLYAADFHNGKIDVVDENFSPVTLAGSFTDPRIPAGFAPFGIESIGTNLWVTYAKQDADKEDDVPGPGNGYVDIFDTSGNLVKRFASNGALDSPWGVALAPAGFGRFAGHLLIGNFGDGTINAFDPASGALVGPLSTTNGVPIAIEGLWGLKFGNGGNGGDTNTLYFTAGIAAGGALEDHGLFGSISAVFRAPTPYLQHNLVSDISGLADWTDPNLLNPWGIAFSATSPFWVSDNHSGLSTLYDSSGTPQTLVVNIPPPTGGTPPAAPTGIIFNNTTNFIAASNQVARFIFSTEDGTISAWASGTNALLKADNSAAGAIYKGLALGQANGSNYLYTPDFHNGKVDVFDAEFNPVTLVGAFIDPGIPAGFAPFNIRSIGTNLFVTYAKQDANMEDDVPGPGNGYVDIFDTSGNLVKRFASNGALDSPWGLALAPTGFGQFGGQLLIGNFGDGTINAFDPVSGVFLGQLKDFTGDSIAIQGLWALAFGNGGRGGDTNTLYFTAGIAGTGAIEDHGLFGRVSAVFPLEVSSIAANGISLTLPWTGGAGPYLVQKKFSLSDTNWQNVMTSANRSVVVAKDGEAGFFRIADRATNSVVPLTVWMSGAGEVPPVTTSASGFGTLTVDGNTLNYHINYTGLSGPPIAAHIHGPATSSALANPIVMLEPLGTNTFGTLSGTIDLATLTSDQVAAIRSGRSYANIHTDANGGGEIRGQIAPALLTAILNGANERPDPVTTTATGLGLLTLIGNQLTYNITYSGLSAPATAGHIHGPADTNTFANVLQPFPGITGTSGAVAGTLILPQSQLTNVIDGMTYINIHTTNNPGGEIRGQVIFQ
jgi:uncharacterized protein (TIGR03118 family)